MSHDHVWFHILPSNARMPQECDNIPFSKFVQIMSSDPLFDSAQLAESDSTYSEALN